MMAQAKILPQSSTGLTGLWPVQNGSTSLLNSYENNLAGLYSIKDWGLTVSYGGEFSTPAVSNIYLISLIKRYGSHTLSSRYTPGYQKDFIFSTGEAIVINDSTIQSLSSEFSYNELFGFGYSYLFNKNISAGITLRYFTQEFNTEIVSPIFSQDTIFLSQERINENYGLWKADIGISYSPVSYLTFTAASKNLFNIGESSLSDEFNDYQLKKEKRGIFGVSYNPNNSFGFNLLYETDNSIIAGVNSFFKLFNSNFGFSLSAFHNKYQSPFFAGITPSLSYSNNIFGISLSGIKYFEDRNKPFPFSDFADNGLDNLINNRYSYDKAVLTFSFTLNTIKQARVKILDVNVVRDVYPTIEGHYLFQPAAYGKIVNISDEAIKVKPLSKINDINNDAVESPLILVPPKDTVEIPFYIYIPESFNNEKTSISIVDFIVETGNNELDDKMQKSILINSSNAWDGRVINLKYFISKGMNSSMNYSKEILSSYKQNLDTIINALTPFYTAKYLFNSLVENIVYTADPRATSEYVQFPDETLKLKGGDCDDLSVLYCSMLESSGIETALVDYKNSSGVRHVNVMFNSGLSSKQAKLITNNDSKYIIRKNSFGEDKIWIPVEVTSLTGFDTAWSLGAEKFNAEAVNDLGIAKGNVEIIEVN